MEKTEREKAFCRAYLQSMDAQRAAKQSGLADGDAMLEKGSVCKKIEKLRAQGASLRREDIVRRAAALAFSRANDAVKLALGMPMTDEELDALDLDAVTEFKRGANGVAEIRFADRVKALEVLAALIGGADEGAAAEFFRALGETEDGAWEE